MVSCRRNIPHGINNYKDGRMMKKAQTEIMGLVVVVILIAVGLLFFIAFVVMAPKSETLSKTTTSVVASSTLNSLQYTTTTCRGLSVQDLLLDCATRQAIVCGNENSCYFANHTIAYILNRTLTIQERKFAFSADVDGTPLETVSINTGCTKSKERENAYQPLRTVYGSLLTISLDVCR